MSKRNRQNVLADQKLRTGLLIVEWVCAIFSIIICTQKGFGNMPLSWVFNISADLVCMFINIFFIMGIMFGREASGEKYNLFLSVCFSNFFALFLDFQSWMQDGNADAVWLVVLINTALYMVNLLLTASFGRFIISIVDADEKTRKKYLILINAMLIITFITRLLNLKYGFMFYVDDQGVYHRGPYQFTAYIYTIIVEIITVYVVFKYRTSRRQRMAVLAFTLLPFVAAIASIFSYGLSITYACVLVSIVMIYSAFFLEMESEHDRIREMFGRFVSNNVVQAIVDNPDGNLIPGRRYNATVLVSDLRGFTALSETLEPQMLVDMLNHYFGTVADVVAQFGGVVTEFLGDGIMCVFGAPILNPDHAERAIAAAITLQKSIPEINRWNREHGYPEIETGIGINTGAIILGSLGNDLRARYTGVGAAIDKTFEIEGCSLGGQILISNSTYKSVKTTLDSRFIIDYSSDTEQLNKIRLYEVKGIGSPWNISYDRNPAKPEMLKDTVDVNFRVIIGKQTGDKLYAGRLVALSEDSAVISCPPVLSVLDNIRLDIEDFGTIFAKVKSVREYSTLISFTSRPSGFADWVAKHFE